MAVATKNHNVSTRVIRSPSIVKLEKLLKGQLLLEVTEAVNKTQQEKCKENKENKENENPKALHTILKPSLTDHVENVDIDSDVKAVEPDTCAFKHEHYRMPLQFLYHKHRFLFMDRACVNKETLRKFHQSLQKFPVSIKERYGWSPTIEQRMAIDLNADLLGVAIAQDGTAMATITFFDVSDGLTKKYDIEKELSLVVLPTFQRRHIATDLVRLSWNLLADPERECWIYVMNSTKSGAFWRKFKQWYPAVKFRLVRP